MSKEKMMNDIRLSVGVAERPYWRLNPYVRELPCKPASGSRLINAATVYDFSPVFRLPEKRSSRAVVNPGHPALFSSLLLALKALLNPLASAGKEGLELIHPMVKQALLKATILTIKGLF